MFFNDTEPRRRRRSSWLLIKLFVKWVMLAGSVWKRPKQHLLQAPSDILIASLTSCEVMLIAVIKNPGLTCHHFIKMIRRSNNTTSDPVSLPYSETITNPSPPTAAAWAFIFHTCTRRNQGIYLRHVIKATICGHIKYTMHSGSPTSQYGKSLTNIWYQIKTKQMGLWK